MSGLGFLFATSSPAKIWNLAARSGPMSVLTRFETARSFDVLQTASRTPLSIASSTSRSTPDRSGMAPSSVSSLNIVVFAACRQVRDLLVPAQYRNHRREAHLVPVGDHPLLPPAGLEELAVPFDGPLLVDQRVCKGPVEGEAVSARTPSQSNRIASSLPAAARLVELPHVAAAAEGRTVLVVATGEKATQRPAASMKGRSSSGNEDAMLLEDCTIERMIRFRKGPALLTFVLLTDEDSTGLTLASGAHLTELQYRRLVPSFHTSTRTHGHTDKGDRGSREEGTGPASRWSTGRGQEFGATSSSPVFTRYTLGTAKWR